MDADYGMNACASVIWKMETKNVLKGYHLPLEHINHSKQFQHTRPAHTHTQSNCFFGTIASVIHSNPNDFKSFFSGHIAVFSAHLDVFFGALWSKLR